MTAGFDFAQARMQARYGERPDASAWAHAHAAATLDAFLESARHSALHAWTTGLAALATHEARERRLRETLRERIAEVARWLPERWRDAMRWTARLIDLPALQHLAAGRPALAWMREEPALGEAIAAAPDPERALRLADEWLASWHSRWPDDDAGLQRLTATVRAHVKEFAHAAAEDAAASRERLAARLAGVFRKEALEPAAAFAYVALLALEAERVRAELVAHSVPGAAP